MVVQIGKKLGGRWINMEEKKHVKKRRSRSSQGVGGDFRSPVNQSESRCGRPVCRSESASLTADAPQHLACKSANCYLITRLQLITQAAEITAQIT